MFSEQILSGFHEGVKAPRLGVGKQTSTTVARFGGNASAYLSAGPGSSASAFHDADAA